MAKKSTSARSSAARERARKEAAERMAADRQRVEQTESAVADFLLTEADVDAAASTRDEALQAAQRVYEAAVARVESERGRTVARLVDLGNSRAEVAQLVGLPGREVKRLLDLTASETPAKSAEAAERTETADEPAAEPAPAPQ